MVTAASLREQAEAVARAVPDPELPFLTIGELGIVRGASVDAEGVAVDVTPTYTGCPATSWIAAEVVRALEQAGIAGARVRTVLAPSWTTDWISESAREKLRAAGIVPPPRGQGRPHLFASEEVRCPRCGSSDTERLSAFGSTPCKALHRCLACREPFEAFKCL